MLPLRQPGWPAREEAGKSIVCSYPSLFTTPAHASQWVNLTGAGGKGAMMWSIISLLGEERGNCIRRGKQNTQHIWAPISSSFATSQCCNSGQVTQLTDSGFLVCKLVVMPYTLRGAVTLRAYVCEAPSLMHSTFDQFQHHRPETIRHYQPEGLHFCRPLNPAILLLGTNLKEQIRQMHKIITLFTTPLVKMWEMKNSFTVCIHQDSCNQ